MRALPCFFYGARTQADLCLLDEIKAIGEAWHPDHRFEFIPVLSEEPEGSGWQGGRGFVTDYVRDHYLNSSQFNIDNVVSFFCGPPPMIDLGIKELVDKGMVAEAIHYDKFEDARSPAPIIDNTKCVLCDECLMVRPTEHCIVEIASLSSDRNGGQEFKLIMPGQTSGLYYNALHIVDAECIRCWACVDACPAGAIDPSYDSQVRALRNISVD